MPSNPRGSAATARRAVGVLLALAGLSVAGCAAPRALGEGAGSPLDAYRAVLGRNAGLSSLRAVVEARISFAGSQVSLPGVLRLDGLDGFRLEVLDPLDRPLAILYADAGRISQYRPAQQVGASLGVFPDECRSVDPADWVAAVLAAQRAPVAGETVLERRVWGSDRSLERYRDKKLRQSVRYRVKGGAALPTLVSWYCGDEPVLQLRLREWVVIDAWRLPTLLEIEYVRGGLTVRLELREIEGNPPRGAQALRPRPGPETRWTSWNLPQ